nr:immunoglobulin heavy chain junction region [Mus musculus]
CARSLITTYAVDFW